MFFITSFHYFKKKYSLKQSILISSIIYYNNITFKKSLKKSNLISSKIYLQGIWGSAFAIILHRFENMGKQIEPNKLKEEARKILEGEVICKTLELLN